MEASDMKAMREALGKIRAELWNNTVIAGKKKFALYEIADHALAAPPRQCDVGTAEEQSKRKIEFCYKQRGCSNCSFSKSATLTQCALAWAQMPYTEGGAS